jgi:XTP/dITP diphosphohydrolase
MEHARKLFPGKKLIIDDRGFFIPALNGFPGAFLKQTITTIGAIGFARLIREEEDKTAKFSSVLGYFDGEEEHYFVDEETGHLVNEPRGDNLHGWSEILKVYCGPKFSDRTLAELSDQEWEEYLSFVGKTDHFSMLVEYLSKQKQ